MGKYTKPVPTVTDLMKPFWDGARRGKLVLQRCAECNAYRFPAREICTRCLSRESCWVPASGKGIVFSYVVMHQPYHPAFAAEVPYAIVTIELAEGPKIVSALVDCPAGEIRIGSAVEACFDPVTDEITLPKFRLCSASPGGSG